MASSQVVALSLLLRPKQLARACALAAALSLGWGSRKVSFYNPLSSPGRWFRDRTLGLSHPHLSMSPFRWNALAISCPPGHKLQFPAGNSPPWQCIAVPRQQEAEMTCTGSTIFAWGAGCLFLCCITPNSKSASSWWLQLCHPARARATPLPPRLGPAVRFPSPSCLESSRKTLQLSPFLHTEYPVSGWAFWRHFPQVDL